MLIILLLAASTVTCMVKLITTVLLSFTQKLSKRRDVEHPFVTWLSLLILSFVLLDIKFTEETGILTEF